MTETISITISVLALAVSSVTAWLTLFRRGTIKMTQPTLIYFGPDGPRISGKHEPPKVYLRTLLFSTAKRGRVIEYMHVALSRNETVQNFNIWVYGEDKLVRGSGLFVGETGIVGNHHFLAPKDGHTFAFTEGQYRLDVFARLIGDKTQKRLFSQALEISGDAAAALKERGTGLYFDWGPNSLRYFPHVERRLPSQDSLGLLDDFS